MTTRTPNFLKGQSLFYIQFALVFLFVFEIRAQQTNQPKYNVLFIIADDLRPELGAYGVSTIQTPNIDKIAMRGTIFERAYAQYPVCNPSRTSFLTGRYPTQTGVMNNNDYFRQKHPEFITLPEHFRHNGYVTLRSGKIFHGGIDDLRSWTEGGEPTNPAITERGKRLAVPARDPDEATDASSNIAVPARDPDENKVASSNQRLSKSEASDRIIVLEGQGESHGDYKSATRAIQYLEKYKNQSFFLAVGFVKPHSPPTAPKKFFDLYDNDRIELPIDFATTPKAPPGLPEISISPRNSDLFIGRESTTELSKEMKRAYYASTSFMDAQVGRVIDALERNGLQENTIIVFFGDHGYHLGEKGKWSKAYSLYEIGLRVPLLIVVPKGKQQRSTQIVQLLDLYPTLVELCGLPKRADLEGKSLGVIIKAPTTNWNVPSYGITEVRGKIGKSVRTNRWHYVEWEEGKSGAMLFEPDNDPHELKNLANDASYADIVKEMKDLLGKMPSGSQ